MSDWIDVFIVALLPLTALFTVLQTNPYSALVSRGILGVVAVMFYAVFGAPDVALTEALVGTLLTVILYVIAVRSSLVVRVGVLAVASGDQPIRALCSRYKLSLRQIAFPTEKELVEALKRGRVDAVFVQASSAPKLLPLFPADFSEEQHMTVLAEHAKWHEKKLSQLMEEKEPIVRLRYRERGGIR